MEPFYKMRPRSCWSHHHHYRDKRILVCYVIVAFVLVCNVGPTYSGSLPVDYLPQVEILEIVSSHLNRSSSINLWKERNSDLIIGEDTSATSRILMKCNATYPVQWVYLGDGKPEFTTFTNVKWHDDPNQQMSFEAEASLGLLGFHGILREEDTGNYTCRSIQEPSVHSYYYIYVPGDALFAAPNGTIITYEPRDQYVRIPCGVSHPKASASLCKRDKNSKVTCPVNGASGFNPKGGFLLNLKKQRDPSGTYVCTANYKGTIKMAEHTLMKESDKPKPKPPSPIDPPPVYVPKPGKNLCDPSPCGKQAECSVVDGRAVCYCFRGLNGNPYDECAPGKCRSSKDCPRGKFCRQGQCTSDPCNPSPCGKGGECSLFRGQSKCTCSRGFSGLPPNCVKSCTENYECAEDEACIKSICQSPCPGPCGQNAECRVLSNGSKRTAQCSCPTGLIGDPLKSCYKFNSTTPGPWNNCPPGYNGHPPACTRKDCDVDSDCPYGRKCVDNVCDKGPNPACTDKCGHFAECRVTPGTNDPVCVCPPGTTGNPLVVCSSMGQPQPPTSWGDPCKPNPCQGPAECRVVQGSRVCACPVGFYGDPSNCIPTTVASYPLPPSSTASGSNVQCRYDTECRSPENCLEGRCQDLCNGICGFNAVCEPAYLRKHRSIVTSGKLVRSQQPENSCTCPPGHEGNPYVSCIPIRDGPPSPPSLPSATAPAEPVCFPSPCARFAECTPVNNAPLCRCLPGYEGNPYQDCRYPVLSPSPTFPYNQDEFSRPTGRATGSTPGRTTGGPTPGRANVPVSPTDLDYQGHSWGHHTDLDLNNRGPALPQSPPPTDNRNLYEPSAGGSPLNLRPPYRDRPYPPPSPPYYDENPQSSLAPRPPGSSQFPPHPSSSNYPSYPPSSSYFPPNPPTQMIQETPPPKTLERPMSPLDPMVPPRDDGDECSFRNPYADYDMDSCGVGRRCERDFRGIKRCVCISPFDCTGPTSIYNRGKCQTNRDCLLSDHICINDTCRDPCSPQYSPCAGVAFSECRVIEGNVLCTCRRGYVGSPASGLDCRPKRNALSGAQPAAVAVLDSDDKDGNGRTFILVHYMNGSDHVINVKEKDSTGHYNISKIWINGTTTNTVHGGSNTISEDDDYHIDDDDSDVIMSSGSSAGGSTGSSTRHHRRHDTNQVEVDKKEQTKENDMLYGHCGFGTGHNCDERSHCRVIDGRPMCVCKIGYRGEFPNCKSECEKSEDCPENMACQYHQCMDPCIEEKSYCATNAFCRVANHTAGCECESGYIGVPWIQCSKVEDVKIEDDCMGFNCEKRKRNSKI